MNLVQSKNQITSKKISIVIVDSALEIMPEKMHKDKTIIRYSNKIKKKPSEVILDVSYHLNAMKKNQLEESWKRGRPDIIHLALLTELSSPLYKSGLSDIYIHTRNNQVIFLNPKLQIRIPKSYARFDGLMMKLFKEKKIIEEEKEIINSIENEYLLKIEDNLSFGSLKSIINPDITIGFSSQGVKKTLSEILNENFSQNTKILFAIGGFQQGYFSRDIEKYFDRIFSISSFNLETHVVISRLIYEIEKIMKIF